MEGGTRMTTESDSLWCETGRSFDKNETLKAKGIAICLLLFHHLFFNKARVQNGGIHLMFLNGIDRLNAWGTDARVCVWMFAFLSAYGLSLQYRKRAPADSAGRCRFVGHYWLSLMKPYWFVFVLQLLLSFFLFKPPSAVYQGNWFYPVVCFFGWSDLFQTPMPSAVWWYMCFAQIVVLMVPFPCPGVAMPIIWLSVPTSPSTLSFMPVATMCRKPPPCFWMKYCASSFLLFHFSFLIV